MALVGSLLVSLSARTDDFERGMRKSQATLAQTRQDLQATRAVTQGASAGFLALGTSFTGLVGGLLTLAALKSSIEGIIQTGLGLDRLRNSFTAITGSLTTSRREFGFVRETASRLGIDVQVLGESYRGLLAATKGTRLEGEGTRDLFTALSNASKAYGLSTEQTGRALLAFQQIISKGKVSQEELRQQLSEALPGASQIAARAFAVTTQDMEKLIEKGIDSITFVKRFTEQLGREAPAAINVAGKGFAALRNEVTQLKDRIAQSGLLAFFDRMATQASEILKASRLGSEQAAAASRQGVSRLGVSPDNARADLVQSLAAVNTSLKQEEERLQQYLASTARASTVQPYIAQTRQNIAALRIEQQALVSSLQQEGLERQRTGAIAAQQSQQQTEILKAEVAAKAAEDERAKARFNEIANEAEERADAEKTAEQELEDGAKRRVQYLTQIEAGEQNVLAALEAEVDRLKLTEDQLARKKLAQEALEPSARARAELLLDEVEALKAIQSLNDTRLQQDEIGAALVKVRADNTRENIDQARRDFRDAQRQLRESQREVEAFGDFFSETILNAADIGKRGFKDFADSAIADLQRILAQQFLRKFVNDGIRTGIGVLGGLLGGGGAVGSLNPGAGDTGLGSVPGLAEGGPIMPGRFYTVGEEGPELLYSGNSSGRVFPGGGAGGATIIINQSFGPGSDANSLRRSQGETRQAVARGLDLAVRES